MSDGFSGFPPATFQFLRGVGENNDEGWFEANRALYEAGYVEPGRRFVEAVGPRLREISPRVNYEPRINGSISRINRDVRFSRDKRPYKDHLDLWFWHGGKRGWDCPGFYMRVTADKVMFGSGMHVLQKEQLERFRSAVAEERAGDMLLAAIAKVRSAGPYEIGGATRKNPPRAMRRRVNGPGCCCTRGFMPGWDCRRPKPPGLISQTWRSRISRRPGPSANGLWTR